MAACAHGLRARPAHRYRETDVLGVEDPRVGKPGDQFPLFLPAPKVPFS